MRDFAPQVCGQIRSTRRFPQPSPNKTTAISSRGSSRNGLTPPARLNSRPSTPSIAWETTKASASSEKSRRILICSACPCEFKIDTDGKTEEEAHRSRRHELAVYCRNLRQAAPHRRRSRQPRAEELERDQTACVDPCAGKADPARRSGGSARSNSTRRWK